jgi:hypothetical protein
MLTILLATCEVTRAAEIGLDEELAADLDRVIERTRAELDALGDGSLDGA